MLDVEICLRVTLLAATSARRLANQTKSVSSIRIIGMDVGFCFLIVLVFSVDCKKLVALVNHPILHWIHSTLAIGYLAGEGTGHFLVGYQIWWAISIE